MVCNIFRAVKPPTCPGTIILRIWETKKEISEEIVVRQRAVTNVTTKRAHGRKIAMGELVQNFA